ncbi:DUF2254 domain-containing protein [Anatilimnocola sp. NA78]|uniref:DUF2254 domain-containing protein n=1 Tax=Anatilimnocola sp. NA78 TaxID=3415683 RepID=UPI003CE5B449
MNQLLRYYWESLRTSYWFLPALQGLIAIVGALGTVYLDHIIHEHAKWAIPWTYTGSPDGARAVLSTIAGSMMTVAGVVFSITIVALSLASGQFGPRLLRNFIRDRNNQFVLGTFTATFLYCLLVLRTVRSAEDVRFVPGISVTIGILLAVFNLGILIYFIHHVAFSIQATEVIRAVTEELHQTIDRLWPDRLGQPPPQPEGMPLDQVPPTPPQRYVHEEAVPMVATHSGYIDVINGEALIKLAREHDLIFRLAYRPGHFVIEGTTLAWAWPTQPATEEVSRSLNRAFIFASQRTPFQDVEFAVDQLVEVAIRALSPGINDPFTALNCIDRLGEALSQLMQRAVPPALRYDEDDQLRVITNPADFRAVTDAAFNQIRQYGSGSAAVLIRMLETFRKMGTLACREDDLVALGHHANLVVRAAKRDLPEPADLCDVEERYAELQREFALRKRVAAPTV